MRTRFASRHLLSISVAAALLAGCGSQSAQGGLQPSVGALRNATSSSYKVLYRFTQDMNAEEGHPAAGLTNVSRTLYGTTFGGTIFSISTTGVYKTLDHLDGIPDARLLSLKGTLYGTTEYGGSSRCGGTGCGIVFTVTTAGVENTLYRFAGGSDGSRPTGGLIDVNGTLYGTTRKGGGSLCALGSSYVGCGTVFSISTSGKEKVLYRFDSRHKDGLDPDSSLLDVNGTLYGATYDGGSGDFGTVFTISTSGKEKVLYSFKGKPDGAAPGGPLISVNGTLYGTTFYGGQDGYGTVYSISTSGNERVLYSFTGGSSDGDSPGGGLLNVNGMLYGTTYVGGSGLKCHDSSSHETGCGTLFSITIAGVESALHSFSGGEDGSHPNGGVVDVNGTLYGTTFSGGKTNPHRRGGGTVYTYPL
jgi:uncharacterized repeat protein (TIGR03803 family)